jgi:hypothetical protein
MVGCTWHATERLTISGSGSQCDVAVTAESLPVEKGSTEAKKKKTDSQVAKKMFEIGEPRNEGKLLWAGIMLPTSETGCVCGVR